MDISKVLNTHSKQLLCSHSSTELQTYLSNFHCIITKLALKHTTSQHRSQVAHNYEWNLRKNLKKIQPTHSGHVFHENAEPVIAARRTVVLHERAVLQRPEQTDLVLQGRRLPAHLTAGPVVAEQHLLEGEFPARLRVLAQMHLPEGAATEQAAALPIIRSQRSCGEGREKILLLSQSKSVDMILLENQRFDFSLLLITVGKTTKIR